MTKLGQTIHATKFVSVSMLAQECCNTFGVGADASVRIFDAAGKPLTRASFKLERTSEGAEVFNVVLK